MRTACLVMGVLVVGLLSAGAAQARCDGMGICRPTYKPGNYTGGYKSPTYRPPQSDPPLEETQRRNRQRLDLPKAPDPYPQYPSGYGRRY